MYVESSFSSKKKIIPESNHDSAGIDDQSKNNNDYANFSHVEARRTVDVGFRITKDQAE